MKMIFTPQTVFISFIGIAIAIVLLIFLLRWWLGSFANKKVTSAENKDKYVRTKKYPWVDVMRYNTTTLLFGLLISIGLIVVLMNTTQIEKPVENLLVSLEIDEEIEIEPPRTAEPPPPPPPAPPPIIAEVPNEEILEEDQPVFEDQTVEEETVFEEVTLPPPAPEEEIAPPPPPPPPPPAEQEVEEIFKVVEKMPLFGGCSDKQCSDQALIKYIQSNINYPGIARENGIEGRVFIRFVVEKDGKVSGAKVVRDIGAGCGDAALQVIQEMNDLAVSWTAGQQRGKPVRVLFTLPATFKLEGS